ncbi:MBOAT family protein [Candidatus Puniceispirillum sp.]|nr:MBOAT family protein [Candidatus Puniceispirillum sp.]
MAIGVARMFGIHLPLNFNSPYKATNIIDFWRCWHITLSRFLRDYLYISLGGNRTGDVRRNINILITMLLGGLWHGAGWTFILWGGLHGVYLLINHTWRKFFRPPASFLGRFLGRTLTIFAVIVAWVPFRAANLECTWHILKAMLGINGFAIPSEYLKGLNQIPELEGVMFALGVKFESLKYFDVYEPIVLLLLSLVVFILPNSQQIVSAVSKTSNLFVCRFNVFWIILTWAMLTLSLIKMELYDAQNNFIYFQF